MACLAGGRTRFDVPAVCVCGRWIERVACGGFTLVFEAGGSQIQGQPGQLTKNCLTIKKEKMRQTFTLVAGHLPSMHQTPG